MSWRGQDSLRFGNMVEGCYTEKELIFAPPCFLVRVDLAGWPEFTPACAPAPLPAG